MPSVIRRSPPQDKTNEIGGCEVELLATIDAVFGRARDEQAFEIDLQSCGVVYTVEEARWPASIIKIRGEHVVDRSIEPQKPRAGRGFITAVRVRQVGGVWERWHGRRAKPIEGFISSGGMGGVFQSPAKLPQDLARARHVTATGLLSIELCRDLSDLVLYCAA